MSNMDNVIALLRRYNKNNRKLIANNADGVDKTPELSYNERPERFGTLSYANTYDALYDKYVEDPNFNIDMWHTAFSRDEQDTYIALLEQNKGQKMSDEYYDHKYYDYNAMMLELYKSGTNNEHVEERFGSEFNTETGEWETVSLGEMGDRDFLEYQLSEYHKNRSEQLQFLYEKMQKDLMSDAQKVVNTIAGSAAEFGEGILSAMAGMADFLLSPFIAGGQAIATGENFFDAYVDYYTYGLTAIEKENVRNALSEWERKNTFLAEIDGTPTWVGKYIGSTLNSIGAMIPSIAIGAATGGASFVGMASFYTYIYSTNLFENATDPNRADSPSWLKIVNATVRSATEALIEWGLAKTLGSTIPNKLLGITGKASNVGIQVNRVLTRGAGAKYLVKSALQEGFEEFLQDFSTNLIDQFSGMIFEGYEKTGVNFQTLMDSFFVGAFASLVMSGGAIAKNAIDSKITRGATDIYVEIKEGDYQKVKGAQKLLLKDIFSDFKSAVNTLNKGKITEKNIELAEEVYTGLTAMTSLFASFDKTRLENVNKLLQRVIDQENKVEASATKENLQNYAANVEEQFDAMIVGAVEKGFIKNNTGKLREKVSDFVKKNAEKLQANGVSDVKSVTSNDVAEDVDIQAKDTKSREIIRRNKLKYDKLKKDYEWIFTTDGRVAIEEDNMLFVSEAWLENYETHEIYKYLAQDQILNTLLTDETLTDFVKDITEFDKTFSNRAELSTEQALMDFLFNKSVYQAYLLSRKGEHLHAFKNVIFRVLTMVELIGTRKKLTKERVNHLKQIIEKIKETWREPTLKAIINWKIDPQTIGADDILSVADRTFVAQYRVQQNIKKNAINKNITARYREKAEALVEKLSASFGENYKDIVLKGLEDDASPDDRLQSVMILDILEMRTKTSENTRDNIFFMPVEALNDFNLENIDEIQLKADAINTFTKEYGIAPEILMKGDISSLNQEQLYKIQRDMSTMKLDNNYRLFVMYKLEQFLGNDYIVTLKRGFPLRYAGETFSKKIEKRFLGSSAYPRDDLKYLIADTVNALKNLQNLTDKELIFLIADLMYLSNYSGISTIDNLLKFFAPAVDSYVKYEENVNGKYAGLDELMPGAQGNVEEFYLGKHSDNIKTNFSKYSRKIITFINEVIHTIKIDKEGGKNINDLSGYTIVKRIPAEKLLSVSADNILEYFYTDNMPISQFLKALPKNKTVRKILLDYTIGLIPLDESYGGYTDNNRKEIKINKLLNSGEKILNTLVHEINHTIAHLYNIDDGGNSEMISDEMVEYILKKYPKLVEFAVLSSTDYIDEIAPLIEKASISKKARAMLEAHMKLEAQYIGYLLIENEIFARAASHNKKSTGFVKTRTEDLSTKIVAPDGTSFRFIFSETYDSLISVGAHKEKVKIKENTISERENSTSLIAKTFDNIIDAYNKGDTTNAYHSALVSKSSAKILMPLLNPALPASVRARVTIDELIRNPKAYLSPAISKKLGNRQSEGEIYYFLRDLLEERYGNISIDRDMNTHEYLLVDNAAFDDLYKKEIAKEKESSNTTFVKKYLGKKVSLKEFFGDELDVLGIPEDASIIIADNVKSQTIINETTPAGIICVYANKKTTNKDLLKKISHEFRHLLQYYNNFETGFTPDFKVTKKMLNDIKTREPDIFKNKQLIAEAKALNVNPDEYIVQNFIYFLVGGELNAYGIRSKLLNTKPIYVSMEAGKPTIFMPWYDAKTGEGRYVTKFLAQRSKEDISITDIVNMSTSTNENVDLGETKPYEYERKKVRKYKTVTEIKNDDGKIVNRKYEYDTRTDRFTKKDAEGTNLMYYYKKNVTNTLAPEMQEFVKATTGHDDKIHPELMAGIKAGKLTRRVFDKWFVTVDLNTINQFTFDLIRKYIFKNTTITSIDELLRITQLDVGYWWAAAKVFNNLTPDAEIVMRENTVEGFLSFIASIQGSKYNEAIAQMYKKYWFKTGRDGKEWAPDNNTTALVRLPIMSYFDGSLDGAFRIGRIIRKLVLELQIKGKGENTSNTVSLDSTITNKKKSRDQKEESLSDMIGTDKVNTSGENVITTLEELLELLEKQEGNETSRADKENAIIDAIVKREEKRWLKKRGYDNRSEVDMAEISDLERYLTEGELKVSRQLSKLSDEDIDTQYEKIVPAKEKNKVDPIRKERIDIVRNIKSNASKLVTLIQKGIVVFNNLPKDVQEMFVVTKTKKGNKTSIIYELKPEVYSVGRGNIKGSKDLRPGTTRAHNTENIERTAYRLSEILSDARNEVYKTKESAIVASRAAKELERSNREVIAKLNQSTKRAIKKDAEENTENLYGKNTRIKVVKVIKGSDTPAEFTIVSSKEMPLVLKSIFDTSFSQMADTKVEFISKDNDGNYYDKEHNKKDFKSAVQHEVTSWRAFYEANRDMLLNLTRTDVLDIVDFIQSGATTFDGPANKFFAFQIFVMGYIIDAARHNNNNWNFSDPEIDNFEKLYEIIANAHGTALNAVGQMRSTINPYRTIWQRALDEFNLDPEILQTYYQLIDELTNSPTAQRSQEIGRELADFLKVMEEKMYDADTREKGRFKRVWEKIKSYRFTAMLSSPMTWIRNIYSNSLQTVFNKSADVLSNFVFAGKAYRAGQWDLSHTKTSAEVKTFVDEQIKNNRLFDELYNGTRYDAFDKYTDAQREVLVGMVTKALEDKYAANHRFDNDTMNTISKFVSKMISDKVFIKFATNRYLGKILTIEVANGNVDLSKGFKGDVLNYFADAIVLANQDYMHKRSFLADMLDGIRDKHKIAYEVLTLWQPFLNSSFNWFAEMLKLTPLGLVKSIYDMSRLEKRIADYEAKYADAENRPNGPSPRALEYLTRRNIGKGIIGMLFLGVGVLLHLTGILDIDEDDEKFYITVGDIKVDITNLFGTSSVIVGAALAKWIVRNDEFDGDEAAKYMFDAITEGFLMKDILDRHRWDTGMWEGLLTETESVLRSLMPQMVQLFVRMTNNQKIKYSSGLKGMLERWINSFVPTQPFGERYINPYTGEIETKYAIPVVGELLKSGLLGATIFWQHIDPIEEYVRNLGVNKGQIKDEITINGEKIILGNAYKLNEKYGALNAKSLQEIQKERHLVQMPDGSFETLSWDKMSDEQKINVIEKTMANNAIIAKIWYWTQILGNKYYANNSMRSTLRKLGITNNVFVGDKGFVK